MITSIQNTKIKHINALLEKQKVRKSERLFVVEGVKMIKEAPEKRMEEVYISESFFQENKSFLDHLGVNHCQVVKNQIFKEISSTVTPQGILGIIRQEKMELADINLSKNPFLIALENLQDPGNMGTIIRTAEAADAAGVIVSSGSVDIYNPKVVRATMGSIFRVPIIPDSDLPKVLKELKNYPISIYAAHLMGSKIHYDLEYKKGFCLLIGNEGKGLSEELTDLADERVKIPIFGNVESLNAAIAAAIIMYEALRQRKS